MFEHLRLVRCVVVTGNARSGTTICAQMIAEDTGHRYVDEADFGTYDVDRWRERCAERNVVVQCPHMLRVIVDECDPAKYVVLMRRGLSAIHESEDRIGWRAKHERAELDTLADAFADLPGAAERKYALWDTAAMLPPFRVEVDYDSLAAHPLWVADRRGFTAKQTRR